jgi:hypothetical protein
MTEFRRDECIKRYFRYWPIATFRMRTAVRSLSARSGHSAVALYAFIDNYCGPKPLDLLVTAVLSLRDELRSRLRRQVGN